MVATKNEIGSAPSTCPIVVTYFTISEPYSSGHTYIVLEDIRGSMGDREKTIAAMKDCGEEGRKRNGDDQNEQKKLNKRVQLRWGGPVLLGETPMESRW